MTPGTLRSWKNPMVADVGDIDDLLEHPLVKASPDSAAIILMTINATLETVARHMEKED